MVHKIKKCENGAANGPANSPFARMHPLHGRILCGGTEEYTSALADIDKIKMYARDAFAGRGLKEKEGELDKLVSLIDKLYTVPSPKFVARLAAESKIELTADEVTKMCWVLLGFQRAINEIRAKKSFDKK